MRAWPKIGTAAALVALLFFVVVIYGYNWGWWGLGFVFSMLRGPAQVVLWSGAVIAVVCAGASVFRRSFATAAAGVAIAAGSAGLGYMPLWLASEASKVPPIHDITTDTVDPPAFVAILPLRADAPNPPEYDTGQTAQQVEAYPDITTLMVPLALESAFDVSLKAVKAEGLKLVDTQPAEGRIEAFATVPMFGFKDDVVVRLRTVNETETEIDIRSKSRVGRSDVGFNARRIRSLLDRIETAAAKGSS
ncbi:MAG: DUF1499 domain-containing protein [Pseudomonadota bacterium]